MPPRDLSHLVNYFAIKRIDLTRINKPCIFGNSQPAQVVKLVDTPDLGSGTARCVGSSPILGTFHEA